MSDGRDILGGLTHGRGVGGTGEEPPSDDLDMDLLDALLDAEGVASRVESIPSIGLEEAPLSPAQRRLWFLHELDPHSTAYTISGAVLLRGALDAAALE